MKITWILDLNDANSILAVLGKLPYEQVSVLIGSLRDQTAIAVKRASLPAEGPPDVPSLVPPA